MNDEKESQQQKVLAAMKDNKKEQTNKTKGFLQGHFSFADLIWQHSGLFV
jgi:hypothetical protein